MKRCGQKGEGGGSPQNGGPSLVFGGAEAANKQTRPTGNPGGGGGGRKNSLIRCACTLVQSGTFYTGWEFEGCLFCQITFIFDIIYSTLLYNIMYTILNIVGFLAESV
jgi:hypothetical protein